MIFLAKIFEDAARLTATFPILCLLLLKLSHAQEVPYNETPDQSDGATNLTIISETILPALPLSSFSIPAAASATTFDAVAAAAIPPDCSGAVSSSNVVTMVNFRFMVQTKSGEILTNIFLTDFWNQGTNVTVSFTFDPVVLFDPHHRRFIATAGHEPRSTNSGVLIGVSMTEDPRGPWNLRRVQGDSSGLRWADFPVIAFNDRFITLSANMLQVPGKTGGLGGTKIFVFDKTNLYAGNFSAPTVFSHSTMSYFPVPNMDQGSTNMFLLANFNGNQAGKGELRFGQVIGSATSPSLAADRVLAVPGMTWASSLPTNRPNLAPQLGATNLINTLDARMRATTHKNGVIYAAHMIYTPATNPVRCVIQYFKMQRNGAFIREIIDDGSSFYAYPNIAVNDFGDVLIGYAKFNTNIYPSAAFKIKYYNEQVFSSENVFAPGEAVFNPVFGYDSQNRLRWGDYTAAAVDPENGRDFWTFGEYSKLTNGFSSYSTRWAKVQLFSPTNDFFTHGVNISGAASTNTVSTERITREAGETNHLGTNYVSVWYNWTAPASGQVNISAGDASVATALAVYTGESVHALTLVAQSAHASSRNFPVKEISNVIFTASSNQTYRIAVLFHPNETEPTEIRLQQQLAPLFITHPSPATNSIIEGYSVTLSGSAIGNPAPSYQWKKNGVEISGATNATHTISSMASGHEGLYTLTASNSFGSATSNGSYLKYFSSGATPLESPVWTNGAFRLSLNDVAGYDYIIYASTNLQTWLPVYTNTVPFPFTDPQSTNYPFRFYRSKFIP